MSHRPHPFRSFVHAWHGIRLCFRTERSFRWQIIVALLVTTSAFVLPLHAWERIVVAVVVMIVLVLELLNSSIERLVDFIKPRLHEYAGDIKDLMAGAVLLASLFSVLIGVIIFWPYVIPVLFTL